MMTGKKGGEGETSKKKKEGGGGRGSLLIIKGFQTGGKKKTKADLSKNKHPEQKQIAALVGKPRLEPNLKKLKPGGSQSQGIRGKRKKVH